LSSKADSAGEVYVTRHLLIFANIVTYFGVGVLINSGHPISSLNQEWNR
jgi:hypothetical protein